MRGTPTPKPAVYLAAALALILVFAACRPGTIDTAVASGELEELTAVGELAEVFDLDSGIPRLVLSLSPT